MDSLKHCKQYVGRKAQLTCSGTSTPGKRSDTTAENSTASSTRNLGMLLLRMAMISTAASSVPTTWRDDNDNMLIITLSSS